MVDLTLESAASMSESDLCFFAPGRLSMKALKLSFFIPLVTEGIASVPVLSSVYWIHLNR